MSDDRRRPMSAEDEKQVKVWVRALLQGTNPSQAANEIYSIGVRTRGAVRTRGTVLRSAPSRFPPGTPVEQIHAVLQSEASPQVRSGVAAALAEFGGPEALEALSNLVLGERRDADVRVRSSALEAIGIIGGSDAAKILGRVAEKDDDPVLQSMARGLIESLSQE